MCAVAVRSKSAGEIKSCFPARDNIQDAGTSDSAGDLGDNISQQVRSGKSLRNYQANGDCRV